MLGVVPLCISGIMNVTSLSLVTTTTSFLPIEANVSFVYKQLDVKYQSQ
jgi:hypothetical protein